MVTSRVGWILATLADPSRLALCGRTETLHIPMQWVGRIAAVIEAGLIPVSGRGLSPKWWAHSMINAGRASARSPVQNASSAQSFLTTTRPELSTKMW